MTPSGRPLPVVPFWFPQNFQIARFGSFGRPSPECTQTAHGRMLANFKNLLMPLFLMGCFPLDFHEAKRPLRTKSWKRPIKAGKWPIKEAKRPIKAMVLVGISVGCLMGCFRAPQPCRKTAPLKNPIQRSMRIRTTDKASQATPAAGIIFVHFHRREHRGSLAIFGPGKGVITKGSFHWRNL